MADSAADSAQATWSAPQCQFPIQYATRVLDDIRLAVMDAFFSLPRGGVEIGGILLGRHDPGRVVISGYVALDCEHATGPSFTLSRPDEARLSELLSARGNEVVGWYHSHTRSDIFLSEADMDIHSRFFPEPWQVALVLKPHTFLPMRLGLFFREADGSVHAAAPCQEVTLEALPMGPVPAEGAPSQLPQPMFGFRQSGAADLLKPVIDVAPVPAEAPAPAAVAAEPRQPIAPVAPPAFLVPRPVPSRIWLSFVALCISLAGGALWMPKLAPAARSGSVVPPSALGLNTVDGGSQMQIRWDAHSPAVRDAMDALLKITDGPQPQFVPLDLAQLQSGVFTYARQGEQVEVQLTVRRASGPNVRQAIRFLGKLPALDAQPDPQKAFKEQQLRRLLNQAPQD